MGWARRASKPIPRIGSPQSTYDFDDYSLGFNSFISNDKFPNNTGKANFWRLAQNARINTLGEYGTRKGFDFHSAAAGATQDDEQESTTGAANQTFGTTRRLTQPFTTASAGRGHRVDVRIRNANAATGTPIFEIWTNDGGEPGVMLARSSVDASEITSSYAYYPVYFIEAPLLTTATTYWIVGYTQAGGEGLYEWSSTTSDNDALVSADNGTTWSALSVDLNFKQYYSTDGKVKGLFRAYKSDGTKVTLFAHGTVLYSVDEVTGALTSVKTGLSSNATEYRFVIVNDIVYYVNGFDGYRKWDFTTESEVNSTDYTNIALHKGLVFLQRKDDPNRVDYSNFGDYETFTSTDFIYVPAPKTGDPTTALVPLNGYLLLFTRDNKYILSGDDNATFALEEAPDQKGTYSQDTTSVDKNFVYYLANDGVYRSNGSEAQLISEHIYGDVLEIGNRETSVLCVNRGRLYLWHRSAGVSANDHCYVWNLNYGNGGDTVESEDTRAPIAHALTAFNDDNQLLVANATYGQVYWQENASNDYTNLGGDIDFLLQTHYNPFEAPGVLKEIRYWNPRFEAQSGNYTISCEYAYDLRDNWSLYQALNVQGEGAIWGAATTIWGAFTWGSTAELQGYLYVPGEYRRIAIRYKHYATRQPHAFLGHTLVYQGRRLR